MIVNNDPIHCSVAIFQLSNTKSNIIKFVVHFLLSVLFSQPATKLDKERWTQMDSLYFRFQQTDNKQTYIWLFNSPEKPWQD